MNPYWGYYVPPPIPIPVLDLSHVPFDCFVRQFELIDLINFCTYSQVFSDNFPERRIPVETFTISIDNDTLLAKFNGFDMRIWLRDYQNPYGPGAHLEAPDADQDGRREMRFLYFDGAEAMRPLERVKKLFDRLLKMFNIENLDFTWRSNLNIRLRDLPIWNQVLRFRKVSILPSRGQMINLSFEDLPWLLDEIQTDILYLEVSCQSRVYKYEGSPKARKVIIANTAWVEIPSIVKWSCAEVEFHDPRIEGEMVREFLQDWKYSRNVALKRVVMGMSYSIRPFSVLNNIGGPVDQDTRELERTIRREWDGAEAKVTVRYANFRFEVLEKDEVEEES